MAPNKLRIQVPDVSEALEVTTSGIHEATGLPAEPVLQEIDHDALIIEVRLAGPSRADSGALARAIEQTSPGVEVLSSWTEASPAAPTPTPAALVLQVVDADALPDLAVRSLVDGIATARWTPHDEVGAGTPGRWELAVPLIRPDHPMLVGMDARRGYSMRFSAAEAAAIRAGLPGAA